MTDNIRNATNQAMRYKRPQVEVIEVNVQSLLCLSDPSVNGWGRGSDSDDIDMEG